MLSEGERWGVGGLEMEEKGVSSERERHLLLLLRAVVREE